MDLLSQVLEIVKLRGTLYFHARFQSPFGMQIPRGQFANYHVVTDGECWLQTPVRDHPLLIKKGDVVLFPAGDSHSLVDSLRSNIVPANELLNQARKSAVDEIILGGPGSHSSSLICGHFEFDRQCRHPLFQTLPSLIHISSEKNAKARWFTTASELAALISSEDSLGKEAVLNRLSESLFIQILSDFVASLDDQSSFLAAIGDNKIGMALRAMHADISHDWTITELAQIASMSKSVFSERFHKMVGEPPIIYLARWRMLKARELLIQTSMPINLISEKVGYQSEFSFSRAFKKMTGTTPSATRKENTC